MSGDRTEVTRREFEVMRNYLAAREAVERSRREQGLPPTVTNRRPLEQVAAILSNARSTGNGPGRNGSARADQDRPRRA